MKVLLAIGGVVVLAVLALGVEVWRRARQLKRITAAIAEDKLGPVRDRSVLISAGARHEATMVDHRGSRLPISDYPPLLFGQLVVTDRDVVLTPESGAVLHIPLERVFEPVLLPSFGEVRAADMGGILRVDWERGGVRVWSVFAIDGTAKLAEQLRREIHLRAGKAKHPAVLMS